MIVSQNSIILSHPFFKGKKVVDIGLTFKRPENANQLAKDLDFFWGKNKESFGLTINRNYKYLKWRIFDNPNINYSMIAAYKGENLVGYIITREGNTNFPAGHIVDIVADEKLGQILNRLSKCIRFISFKTIQSNNFLNNSFRL